MESYLTAKIMVRVSLYCKFLVGDFNQPSWYIAYKELGFSNVEERVDVDEQYLRSSILEEVFEYVWYPCSSLLPAEMIGSSSFSLLWSGSGPLVNLAGAPSLLLIYQVTFGSFDHIFCDLNPVSLLIQQELYHFFSIHFIPCFCLKHLLRDWQGMPFYLK